MKKYFALSLLMVSLVGCASNIVYTGDLGKEETYKEKILYAKHPLSDKYVPVQTGFRIEDEVISKNRQYVAYIVTPYEGSRPGLQFQDLTKRRHELICELEDENINLSLNDSKLLIGYNGKVYPVELSSFGSLDEPLPFCVMSPMFRKELQERELAEAEQKRKEDFLNSPEGMVQRQEQEAQKAKAVAESKEIEDVCRNVAQQVADQEVLLVRNLLRWFKPQENFYTCQVMFSTGGRVFMAAVNYNAVTGKWAMSPM